MAQVDPSASFEERVAQFDQMEAVARKRKATLKLSTNRILKKSLIPMFTLVP
jgi:hypothetical protein